MAVLLERGRAVAAPGVQADQLAVGGLVQGIELEPAAGVRDRLLVFAASSQQLDQASQRPSRARAPARPPRRSASRRSPGCRAARNPPGSRRRTAPPPRSGARARRRRLASSRNRSTSSSRAGSALQGDAVAGGVDPFLADRLAQGRQRAPQRAASVIRVVRRPQQLAERLARARALGKRQMGQQRHRLARVEGDRLVRPVRPAGGRAA